MAAVTTEAATVAVAVEVTVVEAAAVHQAVVVAVTDTVSENL